MSKIKTMGFFCSECGNETPKWMGQCPSCKAWNTIVEAPVVKTPGDVRKKHGPAGGGMTAKASYISEIRLEENDRFHSGFGELDRVLGGGIVGGSLILVGGDPGIGKSTILLQVCTNLSADGKKVLYVSGEESLKQIKMRAGRIGEITGELKFLCETDLSEIEQVVEDEKPEVVVIDSIQTMFSSDVSGTPGSVGQVREATATLLQIGKRNGIAIFIVGHVTKEGQVAGPRMLEHMVDTVLYFEGEKNSLYRIIRGVKNRFGSTNEIGVFEMRGEGLEEVPNPSEYMLSGRPTGASGAVVSCSMEGTRPVMIEVQALVTKSSFGFPKRTAVGTDTNRVSLLMAVLEKRCRLPMSQYDAYVNIAGGVRMNEPAIDLAIIMAIISSCKDIPMDEHTMFFGEVGLSGEVRSVVMAEHRVKEAAKLGFTSCVLPKSSLEKMKSVPGIRCIGVSTIEEAMGVII